MAVLVLVMFKSGMPKKLKWTLVALTLGLSWLGFGLRYSGYFAKGATSAGARLDY
ncbi:MAG: hypothetical protein MZW92_74265 [Comamonadaceae bacterium]|nr:hypothetical protein [Comamonadaceae bacterium]